MRITDSEIIKFLIDHPGWQSATVLALQFGVTTRTIRYHIARINNNDDVIISSPLGYRLKDIRNINFSPTQGDENISNRIFGLLFTSSEGELRLTDIMSQTYFSEVTILKAIQRFNDKYRKIDVRILLRKGYLFLSGDEYQRRRLFHKYIGQKLKHFSSSEHLDLSELTHFVSVARLRDIITSVVSDRDLVINGYEMEDLLLHYVISINRILNGNTYDDLNINTELKMNNHLKKREEYQLTKQITQRISHTYNLRFNELEIRALTLALIGKTIAKDVSAEQLEDLAKYVPQRIIKSCLQVIADTDREYDLNLNDPNFLVRFIIHVQNMVDRAIYNRPQKPIGLNNLTQQYAGLYEMALFMLINLNERLGVNIDRSESIYLLLHLGSYLENNQDSAINTVIVTPKYYNLGEKIKNKLLQEFGNELHIAQIIDDDIFEITHINSKLIITTTAVKNNDDNYLVKISPLLTNLDMTRIRQMISTIKHDDHVDKSVNYLRKYSSSKLFFTNVNFKSKKECLRFGADQLYQQHYTDKTFFQDVMQREELASTNFGSVAIPHALKMKAKKTGIVIMINNNGIPWGNSKKCQLIILIAVSQMEIHAFGDLLQVLISILSVEQNIERLVQVDSYCEFIKVLSEQLKNDPQIV